MEAILLNLDFKIDTNDYIQMMNGYNYDLKCFFYDNGKKVNLTGYDVQVQMRTEKGLEIVQTSNIECSDESLLIHVDSDFTSNSGVNKLQVILIKDGKYTGSWIVNCCVKEKALSNSEETSGLKVDVVKELTDKIAEAVETNKKIEDAIKNNEVATKNDLTIVNAQLSHIKSKNTYDVCLRMLNKESVKIVCSGDSTTFGYGSGGVQVATPYPLSLQDKLRYIYDNNNISTVNSGISGATTVTGLQNFNNNVLSHNPDMCILLYGLNDANMKISINDYKKNLRDMVLMCKENNIVPIIGTSTFMIKNNNAENENVYLKTSNYVRSAIQIAKELNVDFVDLNKEFNILLKNNAINMKNIPDTVHPDEDGYKLMADIILKECLTPNYECEFDNQYLSFKSPYVINTASRNYDNADSKLYYGFILKPDIPNEKIRFMVYNNNPNKQMTLLSYIDYKENTVILRNFGQEYKSINLFSTNNTSKAYDHETVIELGIGYHCFEFKSEDVSYMLAPSGVLITTNESLMSEESIIIPTLLNGWLNLDGGYAQAKVKKISNVVYLQGVIKDGTKTDGTIIFNLPANCRPKEKIITTITSTKGSCSLAIDTNGNVSTFLFGDSSWYSISCSFCLI